MLAMRLFPPQSRVTFRSRIAALALRRWRNRAMTDVRTLIDRTVDWLDRARPPRGLRASSSGSVGRPSRNSVFSSTTRNLSLLASLALIGAFTMRPRGRDSGAEISQLGDIVDALGNADRLMLLIVLLEAATNVLLFLPFGVALGLRGLSIGKTAVYGFVLSVVVECAQWLFITGRTTSLGDVVLNTLGAVAGQALLSRAMPVRVTAGEDPLR